MRYEDNSQAGGIAQGQAPDARDDNDQLTAGSRDPAVGNVISGEGTRFGPMSSDMADGAHITKIAGAGGTDSTLSGGKLQVAGEHGQLTIDADGNYRYVPKANVPENSKDVFTYTLADAHGRVDTADLIIEFGKTQQAVRADAQQVVPGPDGVVVLPEGVQLSDIMVVGRNLVINLPDGTQMVIVDGAVFVPQLVLGGVEVPPTNLATLLIDSEPRPGEGGGPPPSSGGNFEVPVPPLDPGVPLGDLIPPTEMQYKPPEVREPGVDVPDRKPTISIDPGDGIPVINATDEVREAGLPTRNGGEPAGTGEAADGNGSNNSDGSEATTGTILYDSPDGVSSITINGVLVTNVGQVISGDFGTMVITSIAPGAIGYNYILGDNTSGNSTHDDFVVTITDPDGDAATATLQVNIVDDAPIAVNDTDSIAAGQFGPATGNVITDASAGDAGDSDNGKDNVGADNATVSAVSGAGGSDSSFDGSGNLVVNGQYGVLTIKADGSYSYVRNEGTPGGVSDVFTYTLTDGDGDNASATLTITIADALPVTGENATAQLDDDALPGGNPGGIGDDADAANLSGVLAASGGDGALTYAFQTGGAPSGFSYQLQANGDLWVLQGATHVLTVTLNTATGAYTVIQVATIDHAAGSDENNVDFNITYKVTDVDGDSASGTLHVNVDDDTPTIDPVLNREAAIVVDESGPSAAAAIATPGVTKGDDPNVAGSGAIGHSSSGTAIVDLNASFGADGPAAGGGIAYALNVTNATSGLTLTDGSPITLVELGNGVVVGVVQGGTFDGQAAFAISIDPVTGVVSVEQYLSLDHPVNPDPNDPLGLGEGTLAVVGTATDGDGDTVSTGDIDISNLITFRDDGPSVDPSLNANSTVTVDESLPSGTPAIDTGAIVKGDDPDLAGGLAIGQANSGTAIVTPNAAFGADGPAAGGGISYALTITSTNPGLTLTDGTPISLQLVNGVIVGVVQGGAFDGQAAFAIAIDPSTGVVSVEQYLSLDHPVNPDPNDALHIIEGAVGVTVTATDGDGDPVTSGAVDIGGQITFLDDGPTVDPAVNANATVTVDESLPSGVPGIDTGAIVKGDDPDLAGGLALGQANSGSAIVNANAVFGADGAADKGSLSYSLSITNANSGLTLTDGTPIQLQLVNGVIVGVVQGGTFDGQAAFAIAINSSTGVVTVEQYLSLDHPLNPNPNDPLGLGDNTIAVSVTATDGDGDSVTSGAVDISHQITFLDDGPTIDPTVNQRATVTVDESLPSGTPAINTGAIVKGDDPDLAGGLALGQANSGTAIVNANAMFGADGAAAGGGIGYALTITNASSGLTLTDGTPIQLQLVGGVIVGVVQGGTFDGQAAFAIAINPTTGVVSVEQYLSLDHPVNPNPNDPLGLGEGTVGVIVTATDGDGDAVTSGAVDISGQITFLDDGPTIDPVLHANATVTVDESLPSGTPAIDTGAIVKGDDPDLAGGTAIGQANSGVAVVDANAVFGADGAAAGGGLSYALTITSANPGLTLTDGTPIQLQLVNGVIVGVVQGGTFNGQAAFAIAINPTTGVVTVEQYLSLDHPVNPDPNDALHIIQGAVGVTVTATDGDGDAVTSGAIDISGQITFLDDGPTVNPTVNANATVTVDESLPSGTPGINTGAIVKGDDPDLSGGLAIGQANSGSAIVNPNAVFGADGPALQGSISYALSIINANSGLTLTDGTPIQLQLVGGVIVGVVQGGTFNGQAAFAIAINSGTGVVTVEQYLSLDHPINPNPNDPLSFGSNIIGVTVTATDGDGDPVTSGAVDIGGQITFLDDGPLAKNDTDITDPLTDQASGNVITGSGTNEGTANADVPGADGFGAVSGLSGYNGSTDTNPAGGFDVNGQYGTLHMNADGSYTYTRTSGPGGATDSFVYSYVDGDGDPASATLTITIADSTPNLPDPAPVLLDDDALSGGNAGGTGDDPDAQGLPGQLVGTGGDGALTYSFSGLNTLPSGFTVNVVNATTVQVLQGGTVVLTVTLNQTTGAFNVVQNHAIDHPAGSDENNLVFSIGVKVTDLDGDTDPATITINVDDDTPTVSSNGTVQLDDDALAGGNAGGTGDDANSVNATGTLAHSYGADGAGSIAYSTTGAPAGFSYSLQPNGDLWVMQGATHVLTLTVNSTTGAYTVTQVAPIDHPTGNAENNVSFAISYVVTDHDGDTATGSITVNVDDDTPTATATQLTGTVDEDGLPGGIPGGTGDVPGESTTASGNVSSLFSAGADTPLVYQLVNASSLTALGLTSGGVALTYQIGVNLGVYTLTASAGATTVFTLTLDSTTGGYLFTLSAPLDHASGLNENDIVINLSSIIQASDHDGDTVAAGASALVITVDDDTPTVASNGTVQLDDDALAGGNANGTGDDANSVNASGTLAHSYGADGAGSTAYLTTGAPAGFSYSLQPNGDLWVMQGAVHVLTLTVNSTTGAYTVTQVAPIDHPAGSDENNVSFAISYVVTDRDGDTATGSLLVNVDDDTPTVSSNGTVQLDDDALGGGNAGGTGDDANSVNASGTLAHSYGADGAGSVAYATTGAPAGFSYSLQPNGDLWVMQGATHVLTLTVNGTTGAYTVTQVAPIDHPAGGDENNVSFAISYVVTDHDGDTATGSLLVNVDDDTPTAAINLTGSAVAVDETAGLQGDANDVAGPLAVFNGVANKGVDVWMAYQYASNASAVVNSTGSSYGADGAGTTAFSLAIASDGVSSGLQTTDGFNIVLHVEGGLVVGRVVGGADDGKAAFAVSIDSTGHISMVEYLSIKHTNTGSNDESSSITNTAIQAVVTVTDHDGDSASQSINIGSQIQFQDDGPTLGVVQSQQTDNNPATTPAIGTLHFSPGSDGPGSLMTITANNTGLKSGGHALVTNQVGNVLTAYQDVNNNGTYEAGTDNVAVYTVTVNPTAGGSGQYVFDLITPLDPTVTDVPIGGSSSFGAGPTTYQVLTGGGGNLCVVSGYTTGAGFNEASWLATGNAGANLTTAGVNGSTAGWGVDNNNFEGTNEFFNWDFGPQALDDPDGAGAFVPPANPGLPNISYAVYDFINYGAGDDITYVVHFTDGTFASGHIPTSVFDGSSSAAATNWTYSAPAGKFIADIEMYSSGAAPGKVDLVSVGVTSSTLNVTPSFTVALTDGDGDPTAAGAFSVHIATGLVPFAPAAPVVLDLNGDGVHFLSQDAGVHYDYGNGLVSTAWAAADDGILVRDANGNGTVDGASEFVFGHDGLTDLQALNASYGATLDAGDADYAKFGVWQDANSNGTVDAGEYRSLAEAGITAVSLVSNGVSYSTADGDVQVAGTGTYTNADGSTGSLADASFSVSAATTEQQRLAGNDNSLALAAAVAAAGLAVLPAAAQGIEHADASANLAIDTAMSGLHNQVVGRESVSDDIVGNPIDLSIGHQSAIGSTSLSSSFAADVQSLSHGDLSGSHASLIGTVESLLADSGPAFTADFAAAAQAAPTIAMPSVEALQAVGLGNNANVPGPVSAILADALGHGGAPTVDSLLAGIPAAGGSHAESGALDAASLSAGPVQGWDMGAQTAFMLQSDMMMKVSALALHHDAVPPTVHG